MPVDVWRGMNQGLASLNNTFDTLENRRLQQMRMDRQDRIDALQEPILKAQGEGAVLDLAEKRKKISDLRAYDAARKEFEANPGTVPTVTDQDNPAYIPPVPEGLNSTLTYAGEANEVIPAQPARGLPTMEVAGTRPLNPAEMASRRMMLAVQYGQYDEVAKIGTILDLTEKIQGSESAELAKMVANAKVNRQVIGPEAALFQLKREAAAAGVPKKIVDSITMNRDGIIAYPDTLGGIIAIVESPDGKYHIKQVTAKEPKSPTQIDIETKAAQGDPLAVKILKDQEARKIRVAKESPDSKKPTAMIQNIEYLIENGVSREDATKILTNSKPMDRHTFIAQVVKGVTSNPYITDEADQSARVQSAIKLYDSSVVKPNASAAGGKPLDDATAKQIFEEAGRDPVKATKLATDRGYRVQ